MVTGVGADVHSIVCDIDPGEPENMSFLLALDWPQAVPQSFCLKDAASKNIWSIMTTLETSHFEMSLWNDAAKRNIADIETTLDTFHFEMSPLNDAAERNIEDMSFTLDTSQFDRSPVNTLL